MKYLTDYLEEGTKKAMGECNAFWAFSDKQFDEQKKEGIKYIALGAGLICDKSKADRLMKLFDENIINSVKIDVEENGPEKIISREFHNHETSYTYNEEPARRAISNHIEQFPKLFTEELINSVYRECYKDCD